MPTDGGSQPNGKTSSRPAALSSLFTPLHAAAGSLQNPAELEATAAVGKDGPPQVTPLAPVKALLSNQVSQFLIPLEAAKMRGLLPLPFLVSLQVGLSFNVGSKNSMYIPTDKGFPLRGLNDSGPLKKSQRAPKVIVNFRTGQGIRKRV